MVPVRATLLAVAAAASCLAPVRLAHAEAFAQAILAIDNFRLLNASGLPLAAGAITGGSETAGLQVRLGTQGVTPPRQSAALGAPGPDLGLAFLGAAPVSENDFSPLVPGGNLPATFGYADQALAGGAPGASRLNAAGALSGIGNAGGKADGTTSVAFDFMLGVGDAMTIAFDATPFAQAYVRPQAGGDSQAFARLSWRVDIMNLSTGELVFAYQPGELNEFGSVSRNDSFAGMAVYNPGTLAFSAHTPMLNNTDRYQLVIAQSALANALQLETTVPEPASLTLLAIALLAMATAARRAPPE